MSEGIRVLEDYSRFVSENKDINKQLRDIRHKSRKILKELDSDLISARESLSDNGLKKILNSLESMIKGKNLSR